MAPYLTNCVFFRMMMVMRRKGRIRRMITLMPLSGWSVSVVTASSHSAEVASFFSPLGEQSDSVLRNRMVREKC